jgi:hypothetical protein
VCAQGGAHIAASHIVLRTVTRSSADPCKAVSPSVARTDKRCHVRGGEITGYGPGCGYVQGLPPGGRGASGSGTRVRKLHLSLVLALEQLTSHSRAAEVLAGLPQRDRSWCGVTQWSIRSRPCSRDSPCGGQYSRPAQGLWQRASASRRWTLVILKDRAEPEGAASTDHWKRIE